MGVHDRDWYRGGARSGPSLTAAVVTLIVVNVVVFLVSVLLWRETGTDLASDGFGLDPREVTREFALWQLFTSLFLHATPLHLFFNMFLLYMFGRSLEPVLGRARFLRLYFGAGIAASLAYVLLGLLVGQGDAIAVGASGAVMGILVHYTMRNPNQVILLFFLIPMKMKWATLLFIALDVYGFVFAGPGGTNVAHSAHLGGAAYGFLAFRFGPGLAAAWGRRFARRAKPVKPLRREEPERTAEMQQEVDRLLDKIHAGGLDSLSPDERDYLRDASRRLRGDRR